MNTPTQMNRSSAWSWGMTPSATLSATAMATARWAGPNICTACLAPLMVTLLNIMALGLHCRLGATTASRDVKPSLLLVRLLANAFSTALPRGPMIRSTCATSLPSPTRDSPTSTRSIFTAAARTGAAEDAGAELSEPPPNNPLIVSMIPMALIPPRLGFRRIRAGGALPARMLPGVEAPGGGGPGDYFWAWKGWSAVPFLATTSAALGQPLTAREMDSLVAL